MFSPDECKILKIFCIWLTESVEKPYPLIEDVTRLKIDHFRLSHHEVLLRQTVELAPQLLMPLMVSIVQLQHLHLAFVHRVMTGFLDPETNFISSNLNFVS